MRSLDIAALRASINATGETIYLNTGWSGPSPRPVLDRIAEVLEKQAADGPASLESIKLTHDITADTRAVVAELLHAEPDEIMLTHGTTAGTNTVLYGYPWQPGDELVTCSLEHPALGIPAGVLEQRYGVIAKRVAVPPDATEDVQLRLISEAIGPKTRIVALSHIQFSCGLRMPMQALAECAHRAGALVLVDGAQTGGHIAIDVRALGADFYAISGQKWLLGPQGTGAMFMARQLQRTLNPLFTTHEIADGRAAAGEGADEPHPLDRFRMTSQSAPLLGGFGEAVSLIQQIGLDVVEETACELAERLRAGLNATPGCALTGPLEDRATSGLTSVALAGGTPSQAVATLWDRWRIAARAVNIPPAVRFSTHVFNTQEEIDATLDAVRTLVAEGPSGD